VSELLSAIRNDLANHLRELEPIVLEHTRVRAALEALRSVEASTASGVRSTATRSRSREGGAASAGRRGTAKQSRSAARNDVAGRDAQTPHAGFAERVAALEAERPRSDFEARVAEVLALDDGIATGVAPDTATLTIDVAGTSTSYSMPTAEPGDVWAWASRSSTGSTGTTGGGAPTGASSLTGAANAGSSGASGTNAPVGPSGTTGASGPAS
jgi:hypothetical protein